MKNLLSFPRYTQHLLPATPFVTRTPSISNQEPMLVYSSILIGELAWLLPTVPHAPLVPPLLPLAHQPAIADRLIEPAIAERKLCDAMAS